MVAKPTLANARWADIGGADVVAPAGGLRDTGFVAGTPVLQSYVNYLLNQHYQWEQFLDEVFKVAGTAIGDLKLSGAGTFGGALTVGGASTQAAITASGLITANAGVTAGANQDIAVSGTGKHKRGSRVRPIIGVTYVIDAASPFNGGLSSPTAAAYPFTTAFRLPSATGHTFAVLVIPCEEGETLTKVDARVACGSGVTVTMSVKKSDASGSSESISSLGSLATSAGSAGNLETLTSGTFSELVGSGFVYYYVSFSLTAGSSASILGAWATTTI